MNDEGKLATRLPVEPFPETLVEIDGAAGSLRLGQNYQLVVTSAAGVPLGTNMPPHTVM